MSDEVMHSRHQIGATTTTRDGAIAEQRHHLDPVSGRLESVGPNNRGSAVLHFKENDFTLGVETLG